MVVISEIQKCVLVDEALIQATLTLVAFRKFQHTVNVCETRQDRAAWMYLASFLSHTAMVSKLFKPAPSTPISTCRAQQLNEVLKVPDNALLLDRSIRNNVEHFDERIDRWIDAGSDKILEAVFEQRTCLDFLDRHTDEQRHSWFIRRVYLLDEEVFLTEGRDGREEVKIGDLAAELARISECANEFFNEQTR